VMEEKIWVWDREVRFLICYTFQMWQLYLGFFFFCICKINNLFMNKLSSNGDYLF
jgi:hypothetical protein